MTYSLNLRLPEDLRGPLTEVAGISGLRPEEWIATVVRQQLARRDEKLRRHFGSVHLGAPTGTDNEQIDADVAQSYDDDHEVYGALEPR